MCVYVPTKLLALKALKSSSLQGLTLVTAQLNLSLICHTKTPCTVTLYHPLNTGYITPTRTPYPIKSAQVELMSGRV